MRYGYYYAYSQLMLLIGVIWLISMAVGIFTIVCWWKIHEKAGEYGWAAIVPFYCNYVQYKITWGNGWYFLFLLIPFANIVFMIITMIKLANSFGKGGGFCVGLIFLQPIFLGILAFGKDRYIGPDGIPVYYNGYGNYNGYQTGYGNYYQQNPYQQGQWQQNPYQQGQWQQNPYQQNQWQQNPYQQNPYQQPQNQQPPTDQSTQ